MQSREIKDILSGALFIALGLFLAVYSLTSLRLGSASNLGPGVFPLVLSILLALLGAGTLMSGLRSPRGEDEPADLVALVCISGAVIGFTIIAPLFGLVPAILFLLVGSTIFDGRFTLVQRVIFASVLTFIAYLVFTLALRVQLAPLAWPW